MKFFRRFAFITTATTYLLIFIGGLVRVAGAGMGCPDWPKCFDSWVPPLSVSQLPSHIDPALFNFTLAWIEYLNRLSGVFLGMLVLGTAIMALMNYRHIRGILFPAVGALLLTIFEGWYGSVVVEQHLNPITVSVHMVLALVIACLMIYVTIRAYYEENPGYDATMRFAPKTDIMITVLWIAAILQIILGTRVRGGLELIFENTPLLSAQKALDSVGVFEDLHWLFGVILFIVSFQIGGILLKKSQGLTLMVRQAIAAMLVAVLLQLATGIAMVTLEIPDLGQLFHLWFASIYLGMVFIVFTAARLQKRSSHE